MIDELIKDLRCDAEMLKSGFQKNLTELWHSEVVKCAAQHCEEAAALLEANRDRIAELERRLDAAGEYMAGEDI